MLLWCICNQPRMFSVKPGIPFCHHQHQLQQHLLTEYLGPLAFYSIPSVSPSQRPACTLRPSPASSILPLLPGLLRPPLASSVLPGLLCPPLPPWPPPSSPGLLYPPLTSSVLPILSGLLPPLASSVLPGLLCPPWPPPSSLASSILLQGFGALLCSFPASVSSLPLLQVLLETCI